MLCKTFLSKNTLNSSCFNFCQLSHVFTIHIILFCSQFERYIKTPQRSTSIKRVDKNFKVKLLSKLEIRKLINLSFDEENAGF